MNYEFSIKTQHGEEIRLSESIKHDRGNLCLTVSEIDFAYLTPTEAIVLAKALNEWAGV